MVYSLLIVNSYFDSMDFVNPIKTNLYTDIFGIIEVTDSQQYNAYMSYDSAEVQDSYFSLFGESSILSFLSVDAIQHMVYSIEVDPALFR